MAVSLDLAISAIRAGRREEGRQLLNLVIQQNPNDDKAWLWMSSVVDTDDQRARCLYHVLAIDPENELARKGLQRLGIVVSDSRPVKIPRDSQPVQVAKPSLASRQAPPQLMAPPPQSAPAAPAQRRPFLVNPEIVTKELPFTPVQTQNDLVKASPSILSIDVEAVPVDEAPPEAAQPDARSVAPPAGKEAAPKEAFPPSRYTETQKLVEPEWVKSMINGQKEPVSEESISKEPAKKESVSKEPAKKQPKSPIEAAKSSSQAKPIKSKHPAPKPPAASLAPDRSMSNGQAKQSQPDNPNFGPDMPNRVTRPSQPVPVIPPPNQGRPPHYGQMPPQPGHSQVTMGMPHQPPYPTPPHSQMTMGMPMSPYGDPGRPPSEPIPAIHSNSTMGMMPYPYPQSPPNMGFHSNITMMMPTMSESEARARLAGTHPIPVTDASAMALQAGMGYGYAGSPRLEPDYDQDEADSDEINILAVIIFGTLSVTALGGFGMLILLLFTAPPV
ncbi:MAG: hypothetical protein KDJ97_08385 [Anaerolineae bacterium]|nr:hypothetical protein [Anaerolineae bacterium]